MATTKAILLRPQGQAPIVIIPQTAIRANWATLPKHKKDCQWPSGFYSTLLSEKNWLAEFVSSTIPIIPTE